MATDPQQASLLSIKNSIELFERAVQDPLAHPDQLACMLDGFFEGKLSATHFHAGPLYDEHSNASKAGLKALVARGVLTHGGQERCSSNDAPQRGYLDGSFIVPEGATWKEVVNMFEATGMCYAASYADGRHAVVRSAGRGALDEARNMHAQDLLNILERERGTSDFFVTYDGVVPFTNVYVEMDVFNLKRFGESVDFCMWDPSWSATGESVEEALLRSLHVARM